MIRFLKSESDRNYTENGAVTNRTSGSYCLDLFFGAGAMRSSSEEEIAAAVTRAYAEDPEKTMKIVFFARDVRGGLGERRFFRAAVRALAGFAPAAVERNIHLFAEYGRYDDLTALLGTSCEKAAVNEIADRLSADISAMEAGERVSLLAKWLPSVNASSAETRARGRYLAKKLGYTEKGYRVILSKLRRYSDILENRLRVYDYTFDYEKQPSCAMFKYRKAFLRNDNERYTEYLNRVNGGEAKMNTAALYPYDIIRRCLSNVTEEEIPSLDATWRNLPVFGENGNSIAVVDGSGSMTWSSSGGTRPIDVALSLGIYFAEHNKGMFANHFITFSHTPRLIEIKGGNIVEKARFCSTFNEISNTNIEAVFELILSAAVNNRVKQSELPEKIYIISDMEFDCCVEGGNNFTVFETMKRKFARCGYKLPDIIFWNVNGRSNTGNVPVKMSQTGAALVSGCTPAIFDMAMGGEISPEIIMESVVNSERYAAVSA
ncbi:MAG: DUF2828 family protein [Oscillospiraceae bacterium]|nr:DUF2828 family protein [Oscillospiraceae bacterium]